MKNHSLTLLFFCLLNSLNATAQKETYNWHFADNCAVSFVTGVPVFVTGGQVTNMFTGQQEGSSTISDAAGNTLFYTDGRTVWDKNNSMMMNGDYLSSNFSTTQGALIVPMPGSNSNYYLFSLGNGANSILYYSIVDMTLNGGLGQVTTKNVLLADSMTEKQIAIRHRNGQDWWLITHTYLTDEFQCFNINSSGISAPVINHAGITLTNTEYIGSMCANRSLSKIACTYWSGSGRFEVYDFDNSTGTISNAVLFQDSLYKSSYSVAFSASERYLYGGCFNNKRLYQFDLQFPLNAGIAIDTSYHFGQMLLAPDQKIYVATLGGYYLSVIGNPDLPGTACNFAANGFYLDGKRSDIGLPNLIYNMQSFETVSDLNNFLIGIYPNPANDNISLNLRDGQLSGTIRIYNSLGESIYTSRIKDKLDISNLTEGIYIFELTVNDKIERKKIIRQKNCR